MSATKVTKLLGLRRARFGAAAQVCRAPRHRGPECRAAGFRTSRTALRARLGVRAGDRGAKGCRGSTKSIEFEVRAFEV